MSIFKKVMRWVWKLPLGALFLWGLFWGSYIKLSFLEQYTGEYTCTLVVSWGILLMLVISKAKEEILETINQEKEK